MVTLHNRQRAAERIARGVELQRRTGSRDWLDTQPACTGPCQQRGGACPCPTACGLDTNEPRNERSLWAYLTDWLRGMRITWRWLRDGSRQ